MGSTATDVDRNKGNKPGSNRWRSLPFAASALIIHPTGSERSVAPGEANGA